jgi:hypothetical protein
MSGKTPGPQDDRAREAQEALDRVKRDSEVLGTSAMARAGGDKPKSWVDHFAGRDAIGEGEGGTTDPVEVWGRRIGRSLSAVGVIVLAFLLGQQLKLW